MSGMPIRLRLALAFTLALAVVLAAVGAFVYLRLGDSLSEQLDDSLEARATALSALVRNGGQLPSEQEEGFARLVGRSGSTLLTPGEVTRGRAGSFFLERRGARLLVTPIERNGRRLVLVVGTSLDDREEALEALLAQLAIVGPLALLLSAAAGYLLAAAALRPVEAMRRQAAAISSERLDRRLTLPGARDELRRLGETLNAMLGRLETGLARERRFVADASHELRTPLALLRTELELALRRPRPPAELEAALRSAAEEVERLTRLAEDLLVLARADDEGRLPLRCAQLSSDELLEHVARRFAARAAEEGRKLEVAADGTELVADRLRLEQALGNLVDNAMRHGAGTVGLEARGSNGCVELRVSDEGVGFPPGFLPRAFDRFSRTDEARSGGGAGLGLALVETVARAHGGTAQARNGEHGAVVSLTLPVDAE